VSLENEQAGQRSGSRTFRDSPESFTPEAWAPLAMAFRAYFRGDRQAMVIVHSDVSEPQAMPMSLFFRSRRDLRDVDRVAMDLVGGRVLDGGSGVGSLALLLQEDGFDVTAIEIIPEAVEIMKERGIEKPVLGSLRSLSPEEPFDTILLLMNGTALAGTYGAFPDFLLCLADLLSPWGQILIDSTDLGGRAVEAESGGVPTAVHYQLEFEGFRGAPFPQLFLDPDTLLRLAAKCGWRADLVWEGSGGEYLARLTRTGRP
jgi:SAM-dependent methyltransferase